MSATVTPTATAAQEQRPSSAISARDGTGVRARVASLDIVRGVVMVLMAIDHVRVYSGQPAGGPTPGIFFTRWITHFVAPAFLMLAGTAAYLHGTKLGSRAALSRYLFTRGAWLILLELTVIRFCWTFNTDWAHYMLAGVIWMIGWCMILMAGLIHLPRTALATFALLVIFGHNLLDGLNPDWATTPLPWVWKALYFGGMIRLGADGPPLIVLFSIVPWIGVMAFGFAIGPVFQGGARDRRRLLLRLGVGATVLFLGLRALDVYGDPSHWRPRAAAASGSTTPGGQPPNAAPGPGATASGAPPAATPRPPRPRMPRPLAFLATNKYPASLLFLLMTLGPTLVLLALVERARGPIARALTVFGRVPFFYYVLHIPTIHLAAIVVSRIREGHVDPWLFANHPMMNPPAPPGYLWSLGLLYLVWAIVVAVLYLPCRWFADLKQRRGAAWLTYL